MEMDSAIRAERRARKDYERETAAMFNAESESSRKRHARRAQTAARHYREACRDKARLDCDLEALAEYRAA